MEINKNSTMFKLAYPFYGEQPACDQKKTISVCSFFWKFLFTAPFVIFVWLIWKFLSIIYVFLIAITAPFFGYRVHFKFIKYCFNKDGHEPNLTIKYKLPQIRGFRVLPIYFLLLIISGIFLNMNDMVDYLYYPGAAVVIIVGVLCLYIVGCFLLHMDEFDFVRLTKAYIKAKKEKICPVIYVVE